MSGFTTLQAMAAPVVDRLSSSSVTMKWEKAHGAGVVYTVAMRQVQAEPDVDPDHGWRVLSRSLKGCAVKKKRLSPGISVQFRVRYRSTEKAAESPWSDPSECVTPLTQEQQQGRPSPPHQSVFPYSSTTTSLTISFADIERPDAAKEVRYSLQFRRAGRSPPERWILISDSLKGTTVKKKNLEPDTKYEFRVCLTQSDGIGAREGVEEFAVWSEPSYPISTAKLFNPFKEAMGDILVKANGQRVDIDTALLGKKVVMLYFSASWCPPCRQFTPMLAQFYKNMRAAGRSLEIVFVSADRDAMSFRQYLAEHHGDWYAVPYDSPARNKLSAYFKVQGIPRLIVFSDSGNIVCNNAVGMDLTSERLNSFEKGLVSV